MTDEERALEFLFRFEQIDRDSRNTIIDMIKAARDEGFRAGVEAAAREHENINPASDAERLRGDPGAGAMGAVIEYRDKIRKITPPEETE